MSDQRVVDWRAFATAHGLGDASARLGETILTAPSACYSVFEQRLGWTHQRTKRAARRLRAAGVLPPHHGFGPADWTLTF